MQTSRKLSFIILIIYLFSIFSPCTAFAQSAGSSGAAAVQAAAEALSAALNSGKGRAILSQGKIGSEVRGTGGLSIYFPGDRINPAYRALDFCADCRWPAFLERYLR